MSDEPNEICAVCGFTRFQHTEDDLKHFQPSGRFSVFPFIMGGA